MQGFLFVHAVIQSLPYEPITLTDLIPMKKCWLHPVNFSIELSLFKNMWFLSVHNPVIHFIN